MAQAVEQQAFREGIEKESEMEQFRNVIFISRSHSNVNSWKLTLKAWVSFSSGALQFLRI